MSNPKVSVVIPVYKVNKYVIQSIKRTLMQNYSNFEVIVGVDSGVSIPIHDNRLRIINTGKANTGPAEKRDIAMTNSDGEIIGFLDDDSYPDVDWIKKSVHILKAKKIAAVCGPGLTPIEDDFWQKVTGGILSSRFGSGPYFYRFTKGAPRFVDDYPAYNMFVRSDVLKKVGGYGTKFYGGEDTALCIKIINSGHSIYYHPEIVVYHHRRRFPIEYAKQVGNVGRHRGYFVKEFPQTSLRPSYFLPAVFTLALPTVVITALLSQVVLLSLIALGGIWWGIVLITEAKKNHLLINMILPIAIVVNYVAYGYNFIIGLVFTKELIR